jgi:hypothetical protein
MINRNFARVLIIVVFSRASRVCSGVLWGMREYVVSEETVVLFFWVGGIGNGKRRHHGP